YRNGNSYRYPDIDYYSSEYLKKSVNYNNVNAELNAGNRDARFYSNIGWYNNSTLLNVGEGKNEGDNRFNIRGNVDLRLNRFISSTIDVSAVMRNSRRGLSDYWSGAATIQPHKYSPLIPIGSISPDSTEVLLLAENSRNIIDGKYLLGGSQEYLSNPFADLYAGGYLEYVDRILQVTNTIKVDLGGLAKGLSFNTRFNADYYNSYIQTIQNSYSVYQPIWDSIPESSGIVGLTKFGSDERTGNQNISSTSQTRSIGLSMYFDYQRSFGQRNNVSAMLIANGISRSTTEVVQANNNTNLGLQLGYNYDHRYWVDFSGALVSSNKLPENTRMGFSPTISLAWLLSSEDFLSSSKVIDYLKLSASAGILNTDLDISNYYLYENIYSSQAYFSWSDGQFYNQATTSLQGANPDLSFVQRKEINIGIDASLFDKLVGFQTIYFTQLTEGLPTQRFTQYPNYYSTLVPYTNYNSYKRSGLDLLVNVKKQFGDMVLNVGFNATYTNSKITKWDELNADAYQNRTGKPIDAIFGLVSDGFFGDETEITNSPTQVFGVVRPGDIKYVNQNSDNIVDTRDAVEIGKWIAPFSYGVNMSASYKGFTLFMRATGSNGGNGLKSGSYYWVQGDNKYSEVVRDRWTEETSNTATYPRLTSQQSNNNFRTSDFWIYDTDNLNLSRVQISYDFLHNKAPKAYIRQFAIFINGSNLLLIAKNKDIMELNVGSSPQFRVYELGLRANF
ncbi:MAG: SusC/RagA family TonB-linked outer membrane protein, partial [Bacteroidales bacterium]|nr:SusC/RagA family TonB-linked outer membrane protein [Bacteroidales bacterium]